MKIIKVGHSDLLQYFDEINKEYFDGELENKGIDLSEEIPIGAFIQNSSTNNTLASIHIGTKVITFEPRALISKKLARFCMYHEMCHMYYPNHGKYFYDRLALWKSWKPTWWKLTVEEFRSISDDQKQMWKDRQLLESYGG